MESNPGFWFDRGYLYFTEKMEDCPIIDISVTGCEDKISEALKKWGG